MNRFFLVIFVILFSAPSFADCGFGFVKRSPSDNPYVLPKNAKIGNGTQYIADEFEILHHGDETEVRYLQCGPSNAIPGITDNSFVYCSNKSRVLGGDGHIYECNNTIWEKIDDNEFEDCDFATILSRDDSTGSALIAKEHDLRYIFFPNHVEYHKIKDVCKVTLQEYYEREDKCRLQGGEFLFIKEDTDCDTSQAETLTVSVVDDTNNPLSGVLFTYPDMNLEANRNKNIAKEDPAGKYTMRVSHYMGLVDIQIFKENYVSQILTAKQIQKNPTIMLKTGNDTTPNNPENLKNTDKDTESKENQEKKLLSDATEELSNQQRAQNINQETYTPNEAVAPIPNIEDESAELEEKLKTAQDALKKAQDKENSWANRAVSATSTAASGVGGMMTASALAEKKADKNAEAEMQEYISTMKCEYGKEQQFNFGADEITLPGGNELLEYYTEYKTLADNLKTTKAALGLRPGIENEVLYDRAQSGLYQYASIGKTGGGETSLFRALTDESSADAAAWADQKDKTKTKLTAGGVTAGVGVIGGATGNYFINRDKKEKDTKK